MLTNRKKIQIEWGDCDPGEIVYFPRYFEYCDTCTFALFARAGLTLRKMMRKYGIAGIPMVEVKAQFFVSSVFGDTVVAESRIAEWGRSSFVVRHRIYRGRALAVEVFEKRVLVMRARKGPSLFKGKRIPQEMKDRFTRASRARR